MRRWLLFLLLALVCLGCGSHPIPMLIVEGTSGTITIPGDTEIGFGRAWSQRWTHEGFPVFDATNPDEDLQRGETILNLLDENGVFIERLPVRFISRVEVDSAATEANSTATSKVPKQVVVVFDVPANLVDDATGQRNLKIEVSRYRRDMANGGAYVSVPIGHDYAGTPYSKLGWASAVPGVDPTLPIPITVVDHPAVDGAEPIPLATTTPSGGWGLDTSCFDYGFGTVCSTTMKLHILWNSLVQDYVPNPEFSILTMDSTVHPAAWEFDVDYPSDRMSIVGVSLARKKPGEAFLSWEAPDSTGGCTSSTGTLSVKIVDPESLARGVNVAFQLRNTDDTGCQLPIVAGDLQVDPQTTIAYNADGSSIVFPALVPEYFGGN